MPQHDVKLSKILSVMLRHNPAAFGLVLDKGGWVNLEDLMAALRRERPRYANITRADIEQLIVTSDKKRYEIDGDRIRAMYGHSVDLEADYEIATPPPLLYHGTSEKALASILTEGLKPMRRQFVHLSADYQTAHIVGKRHGGRTVVLQIDAIQAHADGVVFYRSQDAVWLVAALPPRYITQS